jgi:hypothetical protein
MIHRVIFRSSVVLPKPPGLPADRRSLLRLAGSAPATSDEVHVIVEYDAHDGGLPFELTRVELVRRTAGWRIQYLPSPWPSELLSDIHSEADDVTGYAQAVASGGLPAPTKIYSSEALQRDGLGPRTRLDTRQSNFFPVLEYDADVNVALRSLPPAGPLSQDRDGRAIQS